MAQAVVVVKVINIVAVGVCIGVPPASIPAVRVRAVTIMDESLRMNNLRKDMVVHVPVNHYDMLPIRVRLEVNGLAGTKQTLAA
jgi:hypothetical protein